MPEQFSSVSMMDAFLRTIGHLSFLPLGLRIRLLYAFRHPDKTPGRKFTVPFYGLSYSGTLDCFIDWHVFFLGAYEPDELKLLSQILSKMDSPVVGDIGANVGHHSIYMSRFAGQIHSFEPWERVRTRLVSHLNENRISNVQVHPVALGEQDEMKTFFAPGGANLGTGSFSSNHATDRNRPSDSLQICNGDSYFRQAGIEKVDLLKIDVEGWEWFVLVGLKETIKRCRPVLIFEFSSSTQAHLQKRTQFQDLFPNYEIFLVTGRQERFTGEELPEGNLCLIPKEKTDLMAGLG